MIVLADNYGPDIDPRVAQAGTAERRDQRLCARPRLSRRDEEEAQGAGSVAGRARGRRGQGLRRHGAGDGEAAGGSGPGVGWQGRHTNLVSRRFGSWLFLGEIFTTLALPPDAPEADHCGTCRDCEPACPTGALERRPDRAAALHLLSDHRAQGAHPARPAAQIRQPHLWLRRLPGRLPVEQVRRAGRPRPAHAARPELDGAAISRNSPGSTMRLFARCSRARRSSALGRDRFVRNVLIAIGNSGRAELASTVRDLWPTPRPWCGPWRCGRRGGCSKLPSSSKSRSVTWRPRPMPKCARSGRSRGAPRAGRSPMPRRRPAP